MIESIVVGTDGSETAAMAVRAAAELASSIGARVHVVSAFQPLSGVKVRGGASPPEASQWGVGPRMAVDSLLEEAAGTIRPRGIEVECYARQGDPADVILDVAEEQHASLIVVGNKGMRSARRFLLGSVPDKISHHASCSVLIVRTS
jgi:nucleotide-binding universal stress UspA family protein